MSEIFETVPLPTKNRENSETKKRWYKKWWGILICLTSIIVVVFVFTFAGLVFYYYHQIKTGKMPIPPSAKFMKVSSATTTQKQFDSTIIYSASEPSSSPDASITIVGFFDFQCPFSREASSIIRQLQTNYREKVNFVFRNFPLTDMHPQAMLAAQAGECAHAQKKFWLMHDKLFAAQNLSEDGIKLYAEQIDLDTQKFNDCLASYNSKSQVLKDIFDGRTLGIRGTPTWFINNKKIEGVIPLETFKKIIDYLLAQQKNN